MQWSKSSIIRGNPSDCPVVTFQPDKIENRRPQEVKDFLLLQQQKSSEFRASPEVAQLTRLVDLEQEVIDERVEQETLARLKGLEETAYKEAYELGLEEGRRGAFEKYGQDLERQIAQVCAVAGRMESLLVDLHSVSEGVLVRLAYEIAQKIVMKEIELDESMIVEVLKGALGEIRNEESIKILLSKKDFEFIQVNKEMLKESFEEFNRFHFEVVETMDSGGCIIETNFGVIDAQMPERVSRVWESLVKEIPRTNEIKKV
jgi:flagellar assembly protein FliH